MSDNGKKKQIEELKNRVSKLEDQVLLIFNILEAMTENNDDIGNMQRQYKELK